MKAMLSLGALACAMAAQPAAAAEVLFDFSGPVQLGSPSSLNGSGVFTVAETGMPSALGNGRTAFAITDIRGMFNGSAITGLLPVLSTGGNRNEFFFDGPFLDAGGVGFRTAAGTNVQLFRQSSNGNFRVTATNPLQIATNVSASATVVPVAAAVPEPGIWAMMLLGFFGMGAALRRKPAVRRTTIAYS